MYSIRFPTKGQARRPTYRTLSLHRITFVITDLEPGGAERQMAELAARLPRDEFEPTVLVLSPPPRLADLSVRLARAGIPVEYFHAASRWRGLATMRNVTRRLEQLRPDILQCFLHHANLLGALAADRFRIKGVITGIRVAERRWNLHRVTARMTDRFVARHVCVSQAVAEFAASSIGLSRSKLLVIPNGVDAARFAGTESVPLEQLGVPPLSRVLVYVGRLDRQKRVDWLIRRMPDLFTRLPNHYLLLVGQGPEQRRLQRTAREVGITNSVRFAGWRSDIPQVLGAADLLLLTSAWEGMPNVVLEAMAAGKPVVATHAEGMAEILGPLSEAPARQLVDRNDADAFVESVVRLASDASLSQEVGLANRTRVEREFTMERMVDRYCDLYRDLL